MCNHCYMYESGGLCSNDYLDTAWDLRWTEWHWGRLYSWYFSFPISTIHDVATECNAFNLQESGSLSRLLKMKALHFCETWGINYPVMLCYIPAVGSSQPYHHENI